MGNKKNKMKKIFFAFLFGLLTTNSYAEFNIHVVGEWASRVLSKFIPDKKVRGEVVDVYNEELEKNGGTLSAESVAKISDAAGWDRSQDKETRSKFRQELIGSVQYYEVCGKDKGKTGAVCVNDFSILTVTMDQATGLAKLYALRESNDQIQCGTKARMDTQTVYSNNIRAMGMAQTTSTPYIQCTSYNGNKFYEFKFNNVDGNIDSTNLKNFKTGICKTFGAKYVTKELRDYKFDVCEGIDDEATCDKVDNILIDANIGYVASWGALGSAKLITGNAYDYCMLYEQVAKDKDGVLLYEKTAFGLDGRVFLNAGIQRKGSAEIKDQIRTYVENTMGKENVKSFDCEDNHHTVKLKGRSGTDDMVRCTINGKTVEFFFDDLSEWEATYDQSGREAMNCIAWGGTFTGKKCIGLDQKMCDKVRDANAQSCPECKKIQWNDKAKVCELPASVSATNLKKGLNYTAIVGGTVVGVVITVGTMGAATAPTSLILTGLAVETLGAGIELKAQIDIDRTADKFFTQSANCHDANCAVDIILEYLKKMSNQQNDMLEEELSAADAELAKLADLIPAESDFYQRMFGNGTDLASNETGEWTSAQIWRAVGIGLQSISVLTGVGKWVIKKSPALQKGLQNTTIAFGKKGKILRNARKVALANVVDYDKLDDVGKEWYTLWKEYAPNNQTFDEFKAMTNGNLDEMKQMSKSWIPRSKRSIINAQIDKQLEEANSKLKAFDDLMDKYDIDAIPADPDELAKLYKQHPDLEQASKTVDYWRAQKNKLDDAKAFYNNTSTSYSTYDPKMSKAFKDFKAKEEELHQWWYEEWDKAHQKYLNNGAKGDFDKSDEYAQMVKQYHQKYDEAQKSMPTQWQIGQEFKLKNLANIVDERVRVMDDIVTSNASINSKLTKQTWKRLSEQERLDVAQQILDDYATRLGTPKAQVFIDPDAGKNVGGYYKPGTNQIYLNPKAQFNSADELTEILSHEYGHLVDDLDPNDGALGSQYSYYANKIYSNQDSEGYRISLTEQSSYAIGNTTGRTAEKTLDQAAEAGLGAVGIGTVITGGEIELLNQLNK